MADTSAIRWFDAIRLEDVPLVGGKNASLGELYRALAAAEVRVPNGFAVTAAAYRDAISGAAAWQPLHALLDDLDIADVAQLAERAAAARRLVYEATDTDALREAIVAAYRKLEGEYGAKVAVAVRSSATAEDLPTASFAGQHDSFLNITGAEDLFEACRRCFASLFTDRAIVYRANNGFDHFKVALSVGVMKMVRSDRSASGVMFTLDTESGFRDVVFITGIYGLGENIVQGKVDPDEFYVHKPTFRQGHRAVLSRTLGRKQLRMVLAPGHTGATTRNETTSEAARARFCISDAEVLELADNAIRIEDHYGARAGHPVPLDIEWAKDADDGLLYIVQARPETVASRRGAADAFETFELSGSGTVLVSGKAVGERIGTGAVRIVAGTEDLKAFRPGEVLVAGATSPDWEPVMKTAGAIVTDHGGRTCHAAIVARELGVPAVVGCGNATTSLRTGQIVTVSCAGGDAGVVLDGTVPFAVTRLPADALVLPRTEIMVNLGNPQLAFRTAMLPNAGVGLARMEFIISEQIGIHPMALVHPERVPPAERRRIEARTRGLTSPADFFVRRLAEGVGTIAAAFYPKPVIVRLSDFKTNEYAALLGGAAFEPHEANPMLGFRGASRYAHPGLRRGIRARMRGAAHGARDDGADQPARHGAVLPPRGRSTAGAGRDGAARTRARAERARDLRHVRDPEQRDPGRRVRRGVRRVLDRFQRPHAAHARRRSGFGNRRLRLRRARPGDAGDAAPRGARGEAQRPACRHLRRGAGEPSGDRPLPHRTRHRLDQRQPGEPAAHDRGGARGRARPIETRRRLTRPWARASSR